MPRLRVHDIDFYYEVTGADQVQRGRLGIPGQAFVSTWVG